MNITTETINELIGNENIEVIGFRSHSKASEHYVDVIFKQIDGFEWKGSIPYFYRRTGLFIETPEDLAQYLNEIHPLFTRELTVDFVAREKKRWDDEFSGKGTTKAFFDKLLNLEWNSVQRDLPPNPNWARRIQDIKEFGYTLSTNTRRLINGTSQYDTHILLVPLPKGGVTGYEIMSPQFKATAIKALGATNVYELSAANKHGLLPDHKFPEIRWDAETMDENPEDMSYDEIRDKFQLIDNQRNQQKREACRRCFQTGKRGTLYGINYFYAGDEDWPAAIPKVGKAAEAGCVGCGWYDITQWRLSLNKKVN